MEQNPTLSVDHAAVVMPGTVGRPVHGGRTTEAFRAQLLFSDTTRQRPAICALGLRGEFHGCLNRWEGSKTGHHPVDVQRPFLAASIRGCR